MPNWATGTLKIKGNKEEILRFCKDILCEKASSGINVKKEEYRRVKWRFNTEEDKSLLFINGLSLVLISRKDCGDCIWLKDSNRNFIDMNCEVPYHWDVELKQIAENDYEYYSVYDLYELPKNKDGTQDYVVIFPFKSAWGLREDYFEELSKKYKLEFRLYVVEQGMGFYKGCVFKDGETTVTDSGPTRGDLNDGGYGQFIWECPFPFLGG